jgi:hypothetical protein
MKNLENVLGYFKEVLGSRGLTLVLEGFDPRVGI